MSKLTLRIENHGQVYTVSEMRRRLAQVLSKLDGGQEVSFAFTATLENYQGTLVPEGKFPRRRRTPWVTVLR